MEQAHLCLTLRGLPRRHEHHYALTVLNAILGQGMGSRLFLEVRENRGLAYQVGSQVNFFADAGELIISAGVDTRKAAEALGAILAECERLRRETAPAEELSRAKELLKGHLLLQLEDSAAQAGWYGRQELLTPEEVLSPDQVTRRIDAVSAEEVLEVADELLGRERIHLAAVGPLEESVLRGVLES
jgi:predicted Zn-dependent peptidase